VIEQEKDFKEYLVSERHRKLTEGTSNSYIDYLNNITNHLGSDITAKLVHQSGSINEINEQLKKNSMPDGSRRNCLSAFRAYQEFRLRFPMDNVIFPDEVLEFAEGAVTQIQVNKYERDTNARLACINHHKPICKVCGTDFGLKYGEIGIGFIHVHHIVPISKVGKQYLLNPIDDLVPVCPNCHAMLHKQTPPYSIDKMKEFISNAAHARQVGLGAQCIGR
jgi:5-methylcytosine-specific restriction enzyme A